MERQLRIKLNMIWSKDTFDTERCLTRSNRCQGVLDLHKLARRTEEYNKKQQR